MEIFIKVKKLYILLITTLLAGKIFAHSTLKVKVLDRETKRSVAGALLQILIHNQSAFTDINGYVELKSLPAGTLILKTSLLGYKGSFDTLSMKENQTLSKVIYLEETTVNFSDVVITTKKEQDANTLGAIDFALRPHLTTQDLLRLVPGLFIAQHAGGGKAEQLFLRGFDVDHGTDVAISVDNMPVNMVSQAHGQGYADLHFVIPETIEKISYSKGPYDAKTGDFNTAGAVRFKTRDYLSKNLLKLEAGTYNTYRGVAMINLLNNTDTSNRKKSAYIAGEYFYSNGFFQNPQDFSKVNLFGKYNAEINSSTNIAFTLSAFSSKWNASGEIPTRAVSSGLISKYGSIDPSEGGNTSRYIANLTLNKKLENGDKIQSNLYFINYNYNLYSNFTFFKVDTVNGDEINQYESRNVFGYNGSYTKETELGDVVVLRSTGGIGLRDDQIGNIGLAHARKRTFLNDIQKGDIHETNFNAFIDENIYLSPRLSINLGLRFDVFHFSYRNHLVDTVNDFNSRLQGIVSPKANVYYNLTKNLQLYVSAGSGFHSNDARVATQTTGTTLPRAIGADIGTNFKLGSRLIVNTAVWILDLASEYTWQGDEGRFDINPNGKTRRIGIDMSARIQLLEWLFADLDVNLAKPRFLNAPAGQDYVPIAPTITNIAGLNVRAKNGITASLRYRYLGARPLIEDNSIQAQSYFIIDAVFGYTTKKFSIGFMAENLLNTYWKEAQYATDSRLQGEPTSVNEVHYTPGTPFNVRANASIFF
jgi:outer membrane receptor protein involved in Fe transport